MRVCLCLCNTMSEKSSNSVRVISFWLNTCEYDSHITIIIDMCVSRISNVLCCCHCIPRYREKYERSIVDCTMLNNRAGCDLIRFFSIANYLIFGYYSCSMSPFINKIWLLTCEWTYQHQHPAPCLPSSLSSVSTKTCLNFLIFRSKWPKKTRTPQN